MFVTHNLTVFYFLFYQTCTTSKGQIQPIGESAAGSTRDGSTRRGLFVLQTYARKRTTPDTLDGDADCKKAIMIGNTISFSYCEAIRIYYILAQAFVLNAKISFSFRFKPITTVASAQRAQSKHTKISVINIV